MAVPSRGTSGVSELGHLGDLRLAGLRVDDDDVLLGRRGDGDDEGLVLAAEVPDGVDHAAGEVVVLLQAATLASEMCRKRPLLVFTSKSMTAPRSPSVGSSSASS